VTFSALGQQGGYGQKPRGRIHPRFFAGGVVAPDFTQSASKHIGRSSTIIGASPAQDAGGDTPQNISTILVNEEWLFGGVPSTDADHIAHGERIHTKHELHLTLGDESQRRVFQDRSSKRTEVTNGKKPSI
jgi:hypothetical protein